MSGVAGQTPGPLETRGCCPRVRRGRFKVVPKLDFGRFGGAKEQAVEAVVLFHQLHRSRMRSVPVFGSADVHDAAPHSPGILDFGGGDHGVVTVLLCDVQEALPIRMVAFFWIGWAVAAVPTPSITLWRWLMRARRGGECTVPCWGNAVRRTEPGPDGALQVALEGEPFARTGGGVVREWTTPGGGLFARQAAHGGAVSWHPTGKRASESTWVQCPKACSEPGIRRASGRVGTWRNNRQDGVVRFWHPNGQLDEAVTWWMVNRMGHVFVARQRRTSGRARFDHGQRVGRWRLWYLGPAQHDCAIQRWRAHHLRCWEPGV